MLRILSFCAAVGVVSLLWSVPLSAAAERPLLTALTDDASFGGPDASLAFARAKVARLNGRADEARAALEDAISLGERKGSVLAVRRAREQLTTLAR